MTLNAKTRRLLAAAVAVTAAAVLVGGARPAAAPPLLKLNPIAIANGAATVSGNLGGSPAATAKLSVNGQQLGVDSSGAFTGVVSLDGASALTLTVGTPGTNQTVDFKIPLTGAVLGPNGIIPANVLDAVQQAGAKLLEPVGGFQAVAGQPLTVGGTVLDRDKLAALDLNGKDVLPLLAAGQSFTTQLPGSTKEITLSARDSQGVTQETHYGVIPAAVPLRTNYGLSVLASQAAGVKIAKIRYHAKRAARTKRIWMVVVVKDRRGYLIRGAKITVRSKAAGRLNRRSQAKRSNKTGRATFVLALKRATFGKRLVMVTVARTPTAKAAKTSSLRVRKRH